MNALNILSAISPTPQPPRPGSASGSALVDNHSSERSEENKEKGAELDKERMGTIVKEEDATPLEDEIAQMETSEHTPLLSEWEPEKHVNNKSWNNWRSFPSHVTSAIVGTVKVVFTYMVAPFRYIITYFIDEQGRISPLLPMFTIARAINPNKRRRSMQAMTLASHSEKTDTAPAHAADANLSKNHSAKKTKRSLSMTSSSTAVSTDSELDEKAGKVNEDSPAQNTRSKSTPAPDTEEIAPSRRSIRIKLHNEQVSKRRKKQEANAREKENPKEEEVKELVAASLKSPSGANAAVKLTRFPRAPIPPRPLVPRRQPSYTKLTSINNSRHAKTLILDLDETLIHSHSKGGRFASGHMVEVKMQHAVGVGGVTIGPQVPILYYVHKRPHCDEFLRKVCSYRDVGEKK
jgi:CTD nuclear envelope phosphatase 1